MPKKRLLLVSLTLIVVVALEASRIAGFTVPIPFAMVYATIAFAAGVGGVLTGCISAAISSALIIRWTLIGAGPATLTGTPVAAGLGVIITFVVAIALGRMRDTSSRLILDLRRAQEALEAQRESLEAEVSARTLEYRRMAERVLKIQEDERAHLSRELHDEFGQALAGLKLHLRTAEREPTNQEIWQEAYGIIDDLATRTRSLSLTLSPALLESHGLSAAIRWYVERQAERSGLAAELELDEVPQTLSGSAALLCFRCVQEAVTNAIKHANARSLHVTLEARADMIHLCVEDDGQGFQVPEKWQISDKGGLGIPGMKERLEMAGGRLTVDSTPGGGTKIEASLPIAEHSD